MKISRASYRVAVVVASVSLATLLRLLVHPIMGERAVFLLAIIATATSAHLAGLWAGAATAALALPIAAVLFIGTPGVDDLGPGGWLNLSLTVVLVVPLCVFAGRFHHLVHQLEQALHRERAARADAERANRVRDEFLAVLSHELRSPLNAIVGWANILKAQRLIPDALHAVEVILRNADHQVHLLSDMNDLSRGLSGKLVLDDRLFDLRAALDQAVDAVRLSADARGVSLQLVLSESPLIVRGELERMRQVFWNLLSNAIKFSPREASVRASADRDGERAVVHVTDTGQGIAADFLPYVFDSFRQEDASKSRHHGGLGLGLAIARNLTEAHGGTVHAASDGAGTGATFTVALPICVGVASEAIDAADLTRPKLDGVRVLVVEDDVDTCELLVRSLRELGATVDGAFSTAQARQHISRQRPDLIVSDIGMPGEDGLTFMRSLKKQAEHRTIPAVALTAYASAADRAETMAAGYVEHVPKPVHPYNLARVIVAALRPPS